MLIPRDDFKTCNFFLQYSIVQYPCIIQQTGHERIHLDISSRTHCLDLTPIIIIPATDLQERVQYLEGRINNQILRVEMLIYTLLIKILCNKAKVSSEMNFMIKCSCQDKMLMPSFAFSNMLSLPITWLPINPFELQFIKMNYK